MIFARLSYLRIEDPLKFTIIITVVCVCKVTVPLANLSGLLLFRFPVLGIRGYAFVSDTVRRQISCSFVRLGMIVKVIVIREVVVIVQSPLEHVTPAIPLTGVEAIADQASAAVTYATTGTSTTHILTSLQNVVEYFYASCTIHQPN